MMQYDDEKLRIIPVPLLSPQKPSRISRFDVDSDVEEEGRDTVTKLERRRQKLYNGNKHPMDVRQQQKKQTSLSMDIGEKYTLRSRSYVPFNQRNRDQNRANRTLENRGGVEQMEKFVYLRQEKEEQDKLHREAQANSIDVNEIEREIQLAQDDTVDLNEYQRELEKMEQDEDDELDELISNLKLN